MTETPSNHETIALFSKIDALLNPGFRPRGYELQAEGSTYRIIGDEGQFYCDAVAADAQAHLAMEFLRRADPAEFAAFRDMAEDDGIDLDDSQCVFLSGKPLEDHLQSLSS